MWLPSPEQGRGEQEPCARLLCSLALHWHRCPMGSAATSQGGRLPRATPMLPAASVQAQALGLPLRATSIQATLLHCLACRRCSLFPGVTLSLCLHTCPLLPSLPCSARGAGQGLSTLHTRCGPAPGQRCAGCLWGGQSLVWLLSPCYLQLPAPSLRPVVAALLRPCANPAVLTGPGSHVTAAETPHGFVPHLLCPSLRHLGTAPAPLPGPGVTGGAGKGPCTAPAPCARGGSSWAALALCTATGSGLVWPQGDTQPRGVQVSSARSTCQARARAGSGPRLQPPCPSLAAPASPRPCLCTAPWALLQAMGTGRALAQRRAAPGLLWLSNACHAARQAPRPHQSPYSRGRPMPGPAAWTSPLTAASCPGLCTSTLAQRSLRSPGSVGEAGGPGSCHPPQHPPRSM